MVIQRLILLTLALLLVAGPLSAADRNKMEQDNVHVRVWNKFADDLFEFHKSRLSKYDIKMTSKMGGYMRMPDSYEEVEYYDRNSSNLLSRIRFEGKNREAIHVIEVYLYDKKKRVIRDYSAAYLPGSRNAPNQTLASLHHYGKKLHAFRSFDASGEVIYEGCSGTTKDGKTVDISLEDYEIIDIRRDSTGMLAPPGYGECFGTLPEKADGFLAPK